MDARVLSRQMRHGRNGYLMLRRKAVAASLFSMGCMALISLYQIGIIRHLPEPPIPGLDADKVAASGEAYRHLQVGDAFLGLVSYAVTAALAAAGGERRVTQAPILPVAAAAKAGLDLVQAGRLTYSEFARERAGCFWCLAVTAATVATAAFVAPEAAAAARSLRGGRG